MQKFIFILVGLCLFAQSALSQTKRALVVAIARYPEASGWPQTSADRDTGLLLPVLREQGFQDICVLMDQEATKAAILEQLGRYSQKLEAGDVFWFHFSGHGQQMRDNGLDESDGLDEALVPFGADSKWRPGARMDLHLRDEELGRALMPIARKIGEMGQLIVSLDACHAGTGTRGTSALLRGSNDVFGPAASADQQQNYAYQIPELPANAFAFFAAAPSESNYEYANNGSPYGSLTYALCKALKLAQKPESCHDVFERVQGIMAEIVPNQHPQKEGYGAMQFLSGRQIPCTNSLRIKTVMNSRLLWVEGGQLAGIFEGSQLAVYPIGCADTMGVAPLAFGSVIRSEALEAKLKLDEPVPSAQLRQSRAYVRRLNPGSMALNVRISLPETPLKSDLLTQLQSIPGLKLGSDSFDVILFAKRDTLFLQNSSDVQLAVFPEGYSTRTTLISEKIRATMRNQWLRRLNFTDESLNLEFDLIPLGKGQTRKMDDSLGLRQQRDRSGIASVKAGDALVVRVQNKGNQAAYFSLLDFQPDGQINMVLPDFEPIRLEPGANWYSDADGHFKPGVVTPPYGTELVKLYATENPVDLSPFLQSSRAAGAYQARYALERFFAETQAMAPVSINSSPEHEKIHTQSLTFQIKK